MYEDTSTAQQSENNQREICLETLGDEKEPVVEIYSKTSSQREDCQHKKIYLKGLKDGGHQFALRSFLSIVFCVFSAIIIVRSHESMQSNTEVLHMYLSLKGISSAISIGLLLVDLSGILISARAFYGLVPDEEFIWPSENLFVLHAKGFMVALLTPVIIIAGILVHMNNVRIFWCVGQFTTRNIKSETRWWSRLSFATDVLQVYILMILAIFVVFNCDQPVDIFVNMVAVQAFSKLDDQTVYAWFQRHETVIENAKLYFKWKSKSGEDMDFEEYHKEVIEPLMVTVPCLDSHPVIFRRTTVDSSSEENS